MAEKKRIAVVMGASGSMGKEVVMGLLGQGFHVIATSRRVAESEYLNQCMRMLSGLSLYPCDITDSSCVDLLFKHAQRQGDLVAAINCAGVHYFDSAQLTAQERSKMLKELMDVNFHGAYSFTHAAGLALSQKELLMDDHQSPERGIIIHVSSNAAPMESSMHEVHIAYAASKAALDTTIKGFAFRLKSKKIRVVGIAPPLTVGGAMSAARRNATFPMLPMPASEVSTMVQTVMRNHWINGTIFNFSPNN